MSCAAPMSVAIVPAAGISQRMGRPKLLLPWAGGTVIDAVLAAWRAGGVTHTVVVVRPDDRGLADICRAAGAQVVVPDEWPPDMRRSVQLGLEFAERTWNPAPSDVWLLAPADMPRLSAAVIARLLREHDSRAPRVLIPTWNGRRGHPILLTWDTAKLVATLGAGQGIRDLVARQAVREVPTDEPGIRLDLDTPEDYQRALAEHTSLPPDKPVH